MKCNNCGAELHEGAAFCGACGATIEPVPAQPEQPAAPPAPEAFTPAPTEPYVPAPAPAEPYVPAAAAPAEVTPAPTAPYVPAPAEQEVAPTTPYVPAAQYEAAPTAPAASYEGAQAPSQPYAAAPAQQYAAPPVYPDAAPAKPKKKHKGLKIFLGIIIALLVICGLLFAFRNSIARAAVGEVNYYAYAEAHTIYELLQDDEFNALLNIEDIDIEADGKVKMINSYSGESQEYTAKFDGAYSKDKKQGTANFSYNVSGEETGPFIVNYGKDKIGIKASSLTDKVATISLNADKADLSKAIEVVGDAIPIIKQSEKTLKDDKNLKVSHEKIDGKNRRVITVSLTEADAYALGAEILENAQKDENLKNDIIDLIKDNKDLIEAVAGDDADLDSMLDNIDEAFENLDKTIDDLKDSAEKADDETVVFEYKVAYKDSDTIYQREITMGESETDYYKVTITTDIGKKEKVLKVVAEDNGKETFNLTLKVEKDGKKRNASLEYNQSYDYKGEDYSYSSTTECSFEAKDLKIDKVGGIAVPVGNIDYEINNKYSSTSQYGSTDGNESKVTGTIEMTAGDTFDVDVSVKSDGKEVMTASLTTNLKDKADLSDYEEPDDDGASISDFIDAIGGGVAY